MTGRLFGLPLLLIALTGCEEGSASSGGGEGGTGGSSSEQAVPLDTAILFPLPQTVAEDSLLRADSAGAMGTLFPSYALEALPALSSVKNTETHAKLRVISANIDPCFPSGVEGSVDEQGVSQCRKQLRLILQPLLDDGTGKLTTEDVSVHTFYEMDEATFTEMTLAIIAARQGADYASEPIDVHPRMRAEGPGGAYAQAIQQIFLDYGGASNLVKVTFSGLRGAGIGWQMGGVDFVGTTSTDMTIPATEVVREEMTNNGTNGDFDAVVDPRTEFSEKIELLLRSDQARLADTAEIEAAFREALLIDNPETELHPGTVDCASCHFATPVSWWVERNSDLQASDYEEAYTNARWNLENRSQTKENTQSTRCFGYYERDVAISQRTINESAAVADFINNKLLAGAK